MSPPTRVLIVRLSAIGDVVHVLPALAALRRAMPDAYLAWIVESAATPLLEGHPMLDELIVYPRNAWRRQGYWRSLGEMRRFVREMRRHRFDVAIDFQGLTKSAIIPWASSIPIRVGYGGADGRELSQWLYTTRIEPPDEIRHVVYRNLHLLTALGVHAPALEFPFPDFSAERERVARQMEQQGIGPGQRLVFLNPGAGWETKRWPPEFYGQLAALIAQELRCGVMFAWGPGEEELVETAMAEVSASLVAAKSTSKRPVPPGIHRAPTTTLRELAALLDYCRVLVGGDTGPVHLAAARGVPVVGIYGGSDPQRNGPLGPGEVRIVTAPDVACHPCWKVRCDDPPPRCLTAITPQMVLEAVRALLGEDGGCGSAS